MIDKYLNMCKTIYLLYIYGEIVKYLRADMYIFIDNNII